MIFLDLSVQGDITRQLKRGSVLYHLTPNKFVISLFFVFFGKIHFTVVSIMIVANKFISDNLAENYPTP